MLSSIYNGKARNLEIVFNLFLCGPGGGEREREREREKGIGRKAKEKRRKRGGREGGRMKTTTPNRTRCTLNVTIIESF